MTYPTMTDAKIRVICFLAALGHFLCEFPSDVTQSTGIDNILIHEDTMAFETYENLSNDKLGELILGHADVLFDLASSVRPISKAVLVYQAGLANVFKVRRFSAHHHEIREAKRILQGTFRDCESFARGLAAAGVEVQTASCNKVGDITDAQWTWGLDECPFRENARSVNTANPTQGDTRNA